MIVLATYSTRKSEETYDGELQTKFERINKRSRDTFAASNHGTFNYANGSLSISEIMDAMNSTCERNELFLVGFASLHIFCKRTRKVCVPVSSIKKKNESFQQLEETTRPFEEETGGEANGVQDEFLKYFWRENFGNSLVQDAANSSLKFMDSRRSLGRAS